MNKFGNKCFKYKKLGWPSANIISLTLGTEAYIFETGTPVYGIDLVEKVPTSEK